MKDRKNYIDGIVRIYGTANKCTNLVEKHNNLNNLKQNMKRGGGGKIIGGKGRKGV